MTVCQCGGWMTVSVRLDDGVSVRRLDDGVSCQAGSADLANPVCVSQHCQHGTVGRIHLHASELLQVTLHDKEKTCTKTIPL